MAINSAAAGVEKLSQCNPLFLVEAVPDNKSAKKPSDPSEANLPSTASTLAISCLNVLTLRAYSREASTASTLGTDLLTLVDASMKNNLTIKKVLTLRKILLTLVLTLRKGVASTFSRHRLTPRAPFVDAVDGKKVIISFSVTSFLA
jgi:hypothetical protein